MAYKIKYEHIKLTNFSKMRVDLAAEVSILDDVYIFPINACIDYKLACIVNPIQKQLIAVKKVRIQVKQS